MIGLRSEIWKEGEYSYPAAYGFTPIIVSYVHEDEDIHPCMLVVPGGGYRYVSSSEADPAARTFYSAGYNVFVLAYNPCAYSMTFNVTKEKDSDVLTLNGILNQRSQDVLTANNWNVCQYAVLIHMLAQVCGMKAGEFVHVIADAHIYDRHIPMVKELISREPLPAPVFHLNPDVKDFYDFTPDDVQLENYETHPQIRNIPVAV